VTAISGSTITVTSAFGGTTKTTVTTSGATTYSSSTTGKASDVTPGKCLTAVGQTKSSILDAFIVTISEPVNGKCVAATTGGFGAGFGGGAGGGFGGPAGGTANG
jgi:hypothetical protein